MDDGVVMVGGPLVWGLALGARHAADADHVSVMASFISERRSLAQASRVALLWSMGHSVTFLSVALLVVAFGLRVPAVCERAFAWLIAATLVLIGLDNVLCALRSGGNGSRKRDLQPLALGSLHGLSGSAGIALFALTTVSSATLTLLHLLLFSFGTVLGMMAFTVALSYGFRAAQDLAGVDRGLVALAGVCSVVLGGLLGFELT